MHRYSLDRSSRKFNCPNCNKKTFVRYVDNLSNEYLEHTNGRCDRETNCKYHKKPSVSNYKIPEVIENKKQKSTIDLIEIANHGRNFKRNHFVQFLKQHFNDDEIRDVLLKYRIGTSNFWNGATVFWQINSNEEVVAGKIMLFDAVTGKRVKKPYNRINWMHKVLKLGNYVLEQCLFGLYLTTKYKGKTIAIVESEKTAIIMSLFLPSYLWVATGSKGNFKLELLKPIKHFKILAFPDKGEYNDWNKRCKELTSLGFDIKCSRLLEDKEVEIGYDLADYYLDSKKTSGKLETNQNNTNSIIKRLVEINPELLSLIDVFGLEGFENTIS